MMKVINQQLEEELIVITLLPETEIVQKTFTQVVKSLATKVSLPGFRQGKVPLDRAMVLVNQKDAWNKTINQLFQLGTKFIDQDNLSQFEQLIGFPIETAMGKFEPLNHYCELIFKYEQKPTVELANYQVIPSSEPLTGGVKETDVELAITKQLENDLMLQPKTTPAAANDLIFFDFAGFLNDQPLKSASAKNYQLDLAKSNFIPGYAEQLIGLKAGDDKTFTIKFPKDYHEPKLQGADVVFKVHVNEVKSKQVPELNDDYVAGLNIENVKTVGAFKDHLRKELNQKLLTKFDEIRIKSIYQWALTDPKNKLQTIPIKNLTHNAHEKLEQQKKYLDQLLSQMGGFNTYIKQINKSEEQILQELFTDLIKELHLDTVLKAIAQKEKITLSEAEINQATPEITSSLTDNPFIKKESGDYQDLIHRIALNKKVIEWLKNKVVYQPQSTL